MAGFALQGQSRVAETYTIISDLQSLKCLLFGFLQKKLTNLALTQFQLFVFRLVSPTSLTAAQWVSWQTPSHPSKPSLLIYVSPATDTDIIRIWQMLNSIKQFFSPD